MRPNMRQIEAFNAVMRCGSVTQAAEQMFISQPAVSKLLKSFEESCGFALFTKVGGRLLPTAEARSLMIETDTLEAGFARIENTARAIRQMERGDISAMAYPALSLRALPLFAARFLRDRPNVRLSLHTRNSADIAGAMLTRMADFGISMVPSNDHGVICRPFAEISLVVALPAHHPLAGLHGPVDLRELRRDRLITLSHEDRSQQIVLETMSRAGVSMESNLEAQMADTACSLVSQGCGVALVPQLASIGWGPDKVVFRPLMQQPKLVMWLLLSAYDTPSQMVQTLISVIRRGVLDIEAGFAI